MARKKLKKSIKTLVEKYLRTLEDQGINIEEAYIFGSQARGTATAVSDIDLCVISPQFKNAQTALRWLWRNKELMYSRIEPVGYQKKEFNEFAHPLVSEIKRNSIQIR